MSDGKPLSRTVQANALQGSEGKTDPEYLKKKEFFENLRVRGELYRNPVSQNSGVEVQCAAREYTERSAGNPK